jgi:cation:H+ antiporter
MQDLLWLLAGFACAAAGGDLFVSGVVRLARLLRLPPALVGATLAAFATSAPEMSVAIGTSLAGEGDIAFGNLAGANVVNLTLVLGLALMLGGLRTDRAALRRDLAVAMAAPALVALLLLDGTLSRADGVALLLAFALWLAVALRAGMTQRARQEDTAAQGSPAIAGALGLAGFALLVAAGWLVAGSAPGVGRLLGLDDFVIGATLVALGTTLPELATVVAARLRGEDEVGIGAILGSCIFNGLFILGLAAAVNPVVPAPWPALIALGMGGLAAMLAVPPPSGELRRRRGVALLALYAGFVVLQIEAP